MSHKKKVGAALFVGNNVVIYYEGQTVTVTRAYADSNGITELIGKEKWFYAIQKANRALQVQEATQGVLEVRDGRVYFGESVVHNVLAERIVTFQEQGLPYEPLLNMLRKLMLNPSPRSREEGYKFLEHRNLPVTPDGDFLGYKCLRDDYTSKYAGSDTVEVSLDNGKTWTQHTGHIPNPIGAIVRMKRSDVDDNFTCECSNGLHLGALGYAGYEGWYYSPGDKVVVVKVNPQHIVSVPNGHDAQKMRVEQYKVVSDFVRAFSEPLVSTGDEREQDAIEDDGDDFEGGLDCEGCGYPLDECECE